jgi:hypothetical protein
MVQPVHDAVHELNPQRLVIRSHVDAVPAGRPRVATGWVGNGGIATERPAISKADEHAELDGLRRDCEHPCRLVDDPVEGPLLWSIQERDQAPIGWDEPGIDQSRAFGVAKPSRKRLAPPFEGSNSLRRRGAQQRLRP